MHARLEHDPARRRVDAADAGGQSAFPARADERKRAAVVAGRDAVIEIVLVPGRLIATANSWSVGEIADTVLESITAEAAREATTATDAGP